MGVRKQKKIRVVYRKLGKHSTIAHITCGLAYPGERLIEIDERLVGYSLFLTLIHEYLHVRFPDWSETRITKESSQLAKLLWKEGYRKV